MRNTDPEVPLCAIFSSSPLPHPSFAQTFSSMLFPNTFGLCPSLNVADQVAYPYKKKTGNVEHLFKGKLTDYRTHTYTLLHVSAPWCHPQGALLSLRKLHTIIILQNVMVKIKS